MDLDPYLGEFDARDWQRRSVEPVRLAVVGLGGFARGRALPAVRDADFCTAAALVSGDPGKADRLADEFGADRTLTYDEFTEGAAADAYDAVYVATPNACHLPYVEAAADQGKAVLCEKPLEATVERAERAVAACEDAGVPLMTAYRMQADPALRRVREMVRDGALGDPVYVRGEFAIDVLAGDRGPDQWRLDPELAGGGALPDIGVYPLNAARFVLDADAVAVSATTAAPDPAFDGVDQHAAVRLEFDTPQRTTASFAVSFRAHIEDTFQVLGTAGQAHVGNAFASEAARPLAVEEGWERVEYEGEGTNEIREEFDYFGHAVRTGAPVEPDGADGLADVRVLAAAYESAATGERVALPR